MLYYVQRECNLNLIIPENKMVKFDTELAISKTNLATPSEDFQYQEDGSIDILRSGKYLAFWHVSNMTGLATNRQSYQLKKRDYSKEIPDWQTIAGTSNHIKVSQTPGFAVFVITQDEIDAHAKATVGLFNTANTSTTLTTLTPKAGILIYGFNFESLENELLEIEEQLPILFNEISKIERFVHLSDVTSIMSQTAELSGLGVAVISSGYTFNFWGIGTLNHMQTLEAGQTYYLIESSQYEPLSYYQGTATIGTLWIETPGTPISLFSVPIRFDGTGIYFSLDSTYQNLPIGTTFRFTQALVLVNT